jgi:uncharacterized protein YbaA (DUF1428 family)
MKYVDGFVIPIPKKNLKAYTRIAKLAGRVWRAHGALEYFECIGDDLKCKGVVPFPKLAKLRRGEVVLFSWIVYKSRAHRKAVLSKVMKDKRMAQMMSGAGAMPFDLKRMSYGAFRVLVES